LKKHKKVRAAKKTVHRKKAIKHIKVKIAKAKKVLIHVRLMKHKWTKRAHRKGASKKIRKIARHFIHKVKRVHIKLHIARKTIRRIVRRHAKKVIRKHVRVIHALKKRIHHAKIRIIKFFKRIHKSKDKKKIAKRHQNYQT